MAADLSSAPGAVVDHVSSQLDTGSVDLAGYGERAQTRSDHLLDVEAHLGFPRPDLGDLKALGDWLVERALEHDQPMVLFRLACEHLHANRLVRPGVTVAERAAATARQRAIEETYFRIADQLDPRRRRQLGALLEVDADLGVTRWCGSSGRRQPRRRPQSKNSSPRSTCCARPEPRISTSPR